MGLPVYRIAVPAQEYQQLTSNIWSEQLVKGSIQMDGKQIPIRIRYRGGHTRGYPKKSFEIRTSSRTYHFNAEYDDPSLLRNALSFRFFESIRVPAPATRHCVLYLNGELLGVYLRIEGVKSFFFAKGKFLCAVSFMRSMIMPGLQLIRTHHQRALARTYCQDTV